ncbi:MAG: hypothetical protein AAGA20_07885 [Planctomycetota bacterium]
MQIRPRHLVIAAALVGAAALADSLLSEPELPYGGPFGAAYAAPYGTQYGVPQGAWGTAARTDSFWSTGFSAGNHDAQSGAGYVGVPGHGPVGYGM